MAQNTRLFDNIIVADDHKFFTKGLADTIIESGIAGQVHKASNGFEVLDIISRINCGLILMDCHMPLMDGITCTQKVKEIQPHIKVATISGTCTHEKLTAALNAGSDGFLTKDMDKENLIWAVKEILDNKKPLCDDAKSILANIQLNKNSPKFELSEREMEVGYMLTKGYTLDEIKEVINVSHSTARDYKLRAMEKTNSKNEKCLIVFLVENKVFENYSFPYKLP